MMIPVFDQKFQGQPTTKRSRTLEMDVKYQLKTNKNSPFPEQNFVLVG